jgi:hypothetical protein
MHMVYPRIGAPHDRVLIDDLPRARDYKLYIIQDCLHLTDAQRRMLKEVVCRDGKTVLWLYAPGIVGDHGLSVDGVSELVGMKLAVQEMTGQYRLRLVSGTHPYTRGVIPKEYLAEDEIGPLFHVTDPGVTELGRAWHNNIKTTKPAFAVKKMPDWTSVYCSVPALPTAVIRNIAREAGAHIYCDNDDFVAANHWLLTVCAASDGPRTIRLPKRATLVDALSGETTAKDASQFEVDMKYGETRVWKLEP